MTCRIFKDVPVATLEQWTDDHSTHGEFTTEAFKHPTEQWKWLVCPCGAKLLIAEPAKGRGGK